MNITSIASRVACLALASGAVVFTSSCQNGTGSKPTERPLVDQTETLGFGLSHVRLQIVPRKVRHSGGTHPTVTGTFDLVVRVNHGPLQRFDLGTLTGSGGSRALTFQDKRAKLIMQDLNHDGIKDTNILHGADGYALISFDAKGRPIRLGFGTPGGGYADPEETRPLGPISTAAFELDQTSGFRYHELGGMKRGASWNVKEQVFDID